MNLRYKSISKIAECLDFGDDAAKSRNILVVDDNLGFFDHSDRASGQIYEIPAWNGPKPTKPHCGNGGGGGGDHSNAITVCPLRKDTELTSLGAIIRSIVAEFGSIQKYLFNRVYSVFRHEYGSKWKQQMKSLVHIHCDDGASIASMFKVEWPLRFCEYRPHSAGNATTTRTEHVFVCRFECVYALRNGLRPILR